jgi:hypothetical protein
MARIITERNPVDDATGHINCGHCPVVFEAEEGDVAVRRVPRMSGGLAFEVCSAACPNCSRRTSWRRYSDGRTSPD